MKILFELLEIIILRRRPRDISYNVSAAAIAFMITIAATYISAVAINVFTQPFLFVITQGLLQTIIFYLLLVITKKKNRFIQTITALFGISAILQLLGFVILVLPALGILGLAITSWNFYLMIVILREAIDCKTLQSVIITILYHFLMGLILLMLFPDVYERMQAIVEAAEATKESVTH